jgi:ferric-dicitrate binding protein FerR (iron transport regulator)/Spy/CpxP family protein refolding chaperone
MKHKDIPLPSSSKEQTESACSRVYNRLQTPGALDHVVGPELSVQVNGATRAMGWWWVPAMTAAAVVLAAMWLGMMQEGGVYGILETGKRFEAGEIVRSGDTVGTTFTLADGSRVEMRAGTELFLEPTDDGVRIRLSKGGVIVNAAKQRTGHLYVQTKDVVVSVVGTVFLVNAEEQGSRVAVIEGEVRVQHGTEENKLRRGEQVATHPLMQPQSVKEEISWSRDAESHVAMLQQTVNTPTAPRAGSVTGVVRTTAGKPASGVRVTAMRSDAADNTLRAMASLAVTDEAGRYRLENVPPGDYYITAGRVDVPTFYPGTLEMAKGTALPVSSAATIPDIDFVVQDASTALPEPRDRLSVVAATLAHLALDLERVRKSVVLMSTGLWWTDPALLQKLGLTEDQKKKIEAIEAQYLAAVLQNQASIRAIQAQSQAALQNQTRSQVVEAQSQAARAERDTLRSRMQAEILQVLTQPQKDQLQSELRAAERIGDRLNRSSVPNAPAPPVQ